MSTAVLDERLRCASVLCPGCKEHGPPTWHTGSPGPDRYAQHPPYETVVLGKRGTLVKCLAEKIWEPAGPQPGDPRLEGMARLLETLLEEMRRRGVEIDVDLVDLESYRDAHPREDA